MGHPVNSTFTCTQSCIVSDQISARLEHVWTEVHTCVDHACSYSTQSGFEHGLYKENTLRKADRQTDRVQVGAETTTTKAATKIRYKIKQLIAKHRHSSISDIDDDSP